MRPYSKINIGDIYASSVYGSSLLYTVVDKAEGLIELRCNYQHPSLSKTIWKKPGDIIFNKRILEFKEVANEQDI